MSKSSSENNDDPPEVGSQWFPCELKKSILGYWLQKTRRFHEISSYKHKGFSQLHPTSTWSIFFRCIKMIHKWSSLIYHVHPTLSFWMYLPWGQRSSQRNKHRTYVVVRQIGQVTWCAETHSHCWMVINPCFIGYCLRYYIYMAMYLLFHRVSTHIYIYLFWIVFLFFSFYMGWMTMTDTVSDTVLSTQQQHWGRRGPNGQGALWWYGTGAPVIMALATAALRRHWFMIGLPSGYLT